jgi:two-component system response regulator RegX3
MDRRARILVVEDEPAIRRGLCDLLAYHGHEPHGVADGAEALRRGLGEAWDLVLLDVMLPEVDGFTICRRIREVRPGLGIVMLTAKGSETDVLEGFSAGCDDYVSKPFSVAQLSARVAALLRRARSPEPRSVELGPITLDVDNLEARVGGEDVALTRRDVELLAYLASERHRIVPREDLLRHVWGYQRVDHVETRCVDMHVVKLRRKLAEVVPGVELIETVRGAGYRLASLEP